MKIGLFFGSFASGGAEKMMINLAKGLVLNGVEPVIYVVKKNGAYIKEVPECITIRSFEAKSGVKSVIPKIRKSLRVDNLDAIIATQSHVIIAVSMASIGIKYRPKLIFRQANVASIRVQSIFHKLLIKIFYQRADLHVAISEGVKSDLISYFNIDSSKISVIYNPVIDKSTHTKSYERISHNWFNHKDKPIFLSVGRISPVKDHLTLLRAFKIVQSLKDSRLVIFGEGDNENYVNFINKEIVDMGLNDKVLLEGFTSNPYKYYRNADVFVITSLTEGFGNVLIEAMSCGCPVVSTDCPSGPKEILADGKYGSLVKMKDEVGLAKAIVETLNNPCSKDILMKRANSFTVDIATQQYFELLKGLI